MMKKRALWMAIMLSGMFLALSAGCTTAVSSSGHYGYGYSSSHYWGPYYAYPRRVYDYNDRYSYRHGRYRHSMGRPGYGSRHGYHRPNPHVRPRRR